MSKALEHRFCNGARLRKRPVGGLLEFVPRAFRGGGELPQESARVALVRTQDGELLIRFLTKHPDPFPGLCLDLSLCMAERDLDLRERSGQPLDALLDVDQTAASRSQPLCTRVGHGFFHLLGSLRRGVRRHRRTATGAPGVDVGARPAAADIHAGGVLRENEGGPEHRQRDHRSANLLHRATCLVPRGGAASPRIVARLARKLPSCLGWLTDGTAMSDLGAMRIGV
jgi:hypothetical protein